MIYRNVVVYWFSGTGNSLTIAEWIRDYANKQGVETCFKSISEANPDKELIDSPDTLLVLVMPSHAFCAPWCMLHFVSRLPRCHQIHSAVLATRASLKFGRIITPGINGSGNFIISFILMLKGYSIRGIQSIDMPSNWTAFHPAQSDGSIASIVNQTRPRVSRLTGDIFGGNRHWPVGNIIYEAVFGLILLPITVLYLLIGRFFLAKIFFASPRCTGCGICVQACPVGALKMRGNRPFWTHHCESCMRCMSICPEHAIEAGHSWAVILWLIMTAPASVYILNFAESYLPFISHIQSGLPAKLVDLLYTYLALFLLYYPFQWLTRFKWFGKLLRKTTLTRFYRRYPIQSQDLSSKQH